MEALQQKCRPKHQVLVLKCYPRTTKGAVDVKPNSSELSYLLFYAQSRRSKIQKVGGFLEKKTASDVYRQRIGNVQVTLHILTALIEKAPKDLPLFAPTVLKVLEQILKSNDITMVESSIPTFEAFCENHDPTSLLADQAYSLQYVSVVRQYATLASTRFFPSRVPTSKPVALRWRNAGLEAIRSVASSDALSSIPGRQYDVVVPMILENLWTDNEDFLDVLLQRAQLEEKTEGGGLLRRRMSNVTVHTVDTSMEPNPIALAGSAIDVDKLAEEDIGVLAMQCLKQIFVVPNRSQIQAATRALLKFIEERVSQDEEVVKTSSPTSKDVGWAIKMFGLVSRWAPVQDRYTILITAIETMAGMPLNDENVEQHSVLAAMIDFLLRSDQNLIGLSVMDVLVQLIAHMTRLVQMPGDPSMVKSDASPPGQPDIRPPEMTERVEHASCQRKELLKRLQSCVGDLATHVYYADQISDMISTILLKLRPSRSSSTSSSSPQVERAEVQAAAAADDQQLDSLLSLGVAKTAALESIKSILSVANPRSKKSGSNISLARNRVPIQVWEGTQWLLRDADGNVRKAYADALVAWLDWETTRADLQARDDLAVGRPKAKRDIPPPSMARRAVSSGSSRMEKPAKTQSHFLALLHVAIYDNALQYIDYEEDIVLLHILLAKLVNKLGVNAVRYGLPMIFRLQEDIQDAETPLQKVRLGSLVHCYFWAVTEKFDIGATMVGQAIHDEIVRRRSKHFWVDGVSVPAPAVELVGTPGMARPLARMPAKEVESEALLPFDDRLALVDCIGTAYEERVTSPPVSPAVSPGRNFTHPMTLTSALSTIPPVEAERALPPHFRDGMLEEWTREDAVLAAAPAGSKSGSLNGSRSANTNRNRLTGQNGVVADAHGAVPLPVASKPSNLRPATSSGHANGLFPSTNKTRHSSVGSKASRGPDSVSSRGVDIASVEQLKLVLSGQSQGPMGGATDDKENDSSDSMVSFDEPPSELSFSSPGDNKEDHTATKSPSSRPASRHRKASASSLNGPLSSHPTADDMTSEVAQDDKEDNNASSHAANTKFVPPLPRLPQGFDGRVPTVLTSASTSPVLYQNQSATLPRPNTARHSVKSQSQRSRRSERLASTAWSSNGSSISGSATIDLAALLKGIDSRAGEGMLGPVTKPPY